MGSDVCWEYIPDDKLRWVSDGRLRSVNTQTNAHAIGVLHGFERVHDRECTISNIFDDLFVLVQELVEVLLGYDLSEFLFDLLIHSLVLQSPFVDHLS